MSLQEWYLIAELQSKIKLWKEAKLDEYRQEVARRIALAKASAVANSIRYPTIAYAFEQELSVIGQELEYQVLNFDHVLTDSLTQMLGLTECKFNGHWMFIACIDQSIDVQAVREELLPNIRTEVEMDYIVHQNYLADCRRYEQVLAACKVDFQSGWVDKSSERAKRTIKEINRQLEMYRSV